MVIGHSRAIWPLADPSWPLHDLWSHQCTTLWSGVLPTKFGYPWAFLINLTPGWPQLTPTWSLTPAIHYTLITVLPTKFGGCRAFLMQFDLWVTFDLWLGCFKKLTMNLKGPCPTTLYQVSAQCIIFLPNWVVIRHSCMIKSLADLHMPFDPFNSLQFERIPAWTFTPLIHYTLAKGSSCQIWWP